MDGQDPFAAGLRTDKAAGRPADQIEKGIRLRALQVDKLPRHIYAGALPSARGPKSGTSLLPPFRFFYHCITCYILLTRALAY